MKTNSIITTRRRLLFALLAIIFLFVGLSVRLFYVQVISGQELKSKAAEQWYRDLPLKAQRGDILDTNGNILVESKNVFTVYARPNAIGDKAYAAKIMAQHLSLSEETLYKKLTTSSVSEITVKKGVDYAVGAALRDLNLEGVYFSCDYKRSYTESNYFTQVLGYTNIDNEGQNGLEGYYDKYLRGTDGVSLTETDNKGIELDDNVTKYVPSIPGATVVTTLDYYIQSFVESAITAAQIEWKSKSVSMAVMDVKTGGIIAMGFTPSYDLENIPRENMDILNAYSKNTMIVDVYEPGSTFKIFTTAAAIEEGVVNDKNTFFCPGYRIVDGQRIKCWRTIGHGTQYLDEGVKNSCNCVFMDLAGRLGTEKFYSYLDEFGFGHKTGVDFFSESAGLLMKKSTVKNVDLARIGFGQAVAVTPLQLLSGVSAVVNGGNYNTPHFVKSITDTYGNNIYTHKTDAKRVLSAETSQKMCTLLEAVVSEGSGKKASVAGYRIGGKTGTAQKYENGAIAQGKYISSFVGFAPADNPEYAILMIIDEPGTYAYYGSLVAAPYVGQVFEKIFDYKNILPTSITETPEYVKMPYLEGKTVTESASVLKSLGIQYEISGNGETVKGTMPIVDTEIPKGDIIILIT